MDPCPVCSTNRRGGRPDPDSLQFIPAGFHTTTHVADMTGLTYRQLVHWVACGWYEPDLYRTGSGCSLGWSADDVERMRRVKARLDWGMTVAAALRSEDPPVPPPYDPQPLAGMVA